MRSSLNMGRPPAAAPDGADYIKFNDQVVLIGNNEDHKILLTEKNVVMIMSTPNPEHSPTMLPKFVDPYGKATPDDIIYLEAVAGSGTQTDTRIRNEQHVNVRLRCPMTNQDRYLKGQSLSRYCTWGKHKATSNKGVFLVRIISGEDYLTSNSQFFLVSSNWPDLVLGVTTVPPSSEVGLPTKGPDKRYLVLGNNNKSWYLRTIFTAKPSSKAFASLAGPPAAAAGTPQGYMGPPQTFIPGQTQIPLRSSLVGLPATVLDGNLPANAYPNNMVSYAPTTGGALGGRATVGSGASIAADMPVYTRASIAGMPGLDISPTSSISSGGGGVYSRMSAAGVVNVDLPPMIPAQQVRRSSGGTAAQSTLPQRSPTYQTPGYQSYELPGAIRTSVNVGRIPVAPAQASSPARPASANSAPGSMQGRMSYVASSDGAFNPRASQTSDPWAGYRASQTYVIPTTAGQAPGFDSRASVTSARTMPGRAMAPRWTSEDDLLADLDDPDEDEKASSNGDVVSIALPERRSDVSDSNRSDTLPSKPPLPSPAASSSSGHESCCPICLVPMPPDEIDEHIEEIHNASFYKEAGQIVAREAPSLEL